MSNLTRHIFHKSIKPRIQAKKLANNRHNQFYVLVTTNQIKLYIYPDLLKENPLLRKLLNSESTAYFLDGTLYHTHIPLFSLMISAATVIKAIKYSNYYIIHNSYDASTKYSVIALQLVKLSYLVGSYDKSNVYFHLTCLFPKYWKLLPLSHYRFIDHAVKHKKILYS